MKKFRADDIIIGQEIVYFNEHKKRSLGRVVSYSYWIGKGFDYIIVKPYIGDKNIKVKSKEVVGLVMPTIKKGNF